MGAVTYPNVTVITMLNENFVPVQVKIDQSAKLADKYQAIWTPNINILNHREQLVSQIIGWQSPSEFPAWLTLGQGQYHLHRKDFEAAVTCFEQTFDHFPESQWAPEALYFAAVCKYMAAKDANQLTQGWEKLRHYYPHSTWSMRANV